VPTPRPASPSPSSSSRAFEAGDVIWVLKRSTLFYVQGLFFGPDKPADLTTRLTTLAQAAYARV
jgi:hypothetical protein